MCFKFFCVSGCDQMKLVAAFCITSTLTDPLQFWGGMAYHTSWETQTQTGSWLQISEKRSQLYVDISLENVNLNKPLLLSCKRQLTAELLPVDPSFPPKAHLLRFLQSSWEEIVCWAFATDPTSISPSSCCTRLWLH